MFCAEPAKDLQDYCESKIAIGGPTAVGLSVTGEPYDILLMTGAASREAALEAAKREFDRYLADATPNSKLYWRIPPEIGENSSNSERASWGFYMRLLISDKPPVKED